MHSITATTLQGMYLNDMLTLEEYVNFRNCMKWEKWHTRSPFLLSRFTEHQCIELYRFEKCELRQLVAELQLPDQCKTRQGHSFTGLEGLCILLARLSTPAKLSLHIDTFNRDRSALSRIFHWMIQYISTNYQYLLTFDQPWLNEATLLMYAEACALAGSPLPNIVGFIDGTARAICRPVRDQRNQYSGHKRHHVIKYQAVTYPNGIIGRLDGAYDGRRHDAHMLYASGILTDISRKWVSQDGSFFRLFGDKGYTNSKYIVAPFKGQVSDAQEAFNGKLGQLRVHVEYGFGKVVNLFPFVDFVKQNKLLLQPVNKTYIVATILTNCHTCLRGSQIAKAFSCTPMTLAEYLRK